MNAWTQTNDRMPLLPWVGRLIKADFSHDNLTLPRVLLSQDNPVSRLTLALGGSESVYLRHLMHIN